MNDFKNNIIQKIKAGEIEMKPRWHFVLKTLLVVTGTLITALLAIYLLSLIFFTLHRSGLIFAPGFGMRGIGLFITSSPWLLILLVVVFLIILYILVKQYSFSYKRPLLYSMLGIFIFVMLGSFVAEQTKMHDRIEAFTQRYNVPGAGPLYKTMMEELPENVTYGTITAITEDGFEIQTEEETVAVSVTDHTRRRQGEVYQVGEKIFIFGDRDEAESIQAFGIKKVDDTFRRRMHFNNQEGQLIQPRLQQRIEMHESILR